MATIKWLPGGAALAALALLSSAAAAAEKPRDDGPKVTVKLSISVEEYDPNELSKGIVRCWLVNRSEQAVDVWLGLESQKNWLSSQDRGLRWPLTLRPWKALERKPSQVSVKPGAEQVLFELSLDEILLNTTEKDPSTKTERKWAWDWVARPQAPPSPIHRWRRGGYAPQATFWAEVTTAKGRMLTSNKVVLKVESGQ